MLVRILADNPGQTFTRNLDAKFVSTVKELLRDGRDMSVQQILRETLDTFELQKSQDETLVPLITMWKNEKTKWAKRSGNDISSGLVSVVCLFPRDQKLTLPVDQAAEPWWWIWRTSVRPRPASLRPSAQVLTKS